MDRPAGDEVPMSVAIPFPAPDPGRSRYPTRSTILGQQPIGFPRLALLDPDRLPYRFGDERATPEQVVRLWDMAIRMIRLSAIEWFDGFPDGLLAEALGLETHEATEHRRDLDAMPSGTDSEDVLVRDVLIDMARNRLPGPLGFPALSWTIALFEIIANHQPMGAMSPREAVVFNALLETFKRDYEVSQRMRRPREFRGAWRS
jgi:hypothetical protein